MLTKIIYQPLLLWYVRCLVGLQISFTVLCIDFKQLSLIIMLNTRSSTLFLFFYKLQKERQFGVTSNPDDNQ